MKKGKLSVTLLAMTLMVILPLISAYSWGAGYYNSPLDYLDNEWTIFGVIFLVFFAIIYFAVNRSFNNNLISGVVAAGISLFIALTLARRGILYGYVGNEIGSWVLMLAILVGIGFLIKFAYGSFGIKGTAISFVLLWYIIHIIDPYEFLPYEILSNTFMNIYEFIASWTFGIILIILSIFLSIANIESEKEREDRIKGRRKIRFFSRN